MSWRDCTEAAEAIDCCKWCGLRLQPRDGIGSDQCWTCRTEGPPAELQGPEPNYTGVYELRDE